MRRAEFQELRRDRSLSFLEKEKYEIYLDETSRVGKLKWLTGKNVTGLMVSFFLQVFQTKLGHVLPPLLRYVAFII